MSKEGFTHIVSQKMVDEKRSSKPVLNHGFFSPPKETNYITIEHNLIVNHALAGVKAYIKSNIAGEEGKRRGFVCEKLLEDSLDLDVEQKLKLVYALLHLNKPDKPLKLQMYVYNSMGCNGLNDARQKIESCSKKTKMQEKLNSIVGEFKRLEGVFFYEDVSLVLIELKKILTCPSQLEPAKNSTVISNTPKK